MISPTTYCSILVTVLWKVIWLLCLHVFTALLLLSSLLSGAHSQSPLELLLSILMITSSSQTLSAFPLLESHISHWSHCSFLSFFSLIFPDIVVLLIDWVFAGSSVVTSTLNFGVFWGLLLFLSPSPSPSFVHCSPLLPSHYPLISSPSSLLYIRFLCRWSHPHSLFQITFYMYYLRARTWVSYYY